MPGQVETDASWVREGLSCGLQSRDGISAEGDTMWGCGHILTRMISEAKGLGCTVCVLVPLFRRWGMERRLESSGYLSVE